MRTLKAIAVLVFLGAAGLIGYAYLGDLTPDRTETRIPVEIDGS